MKSYIPLFSSIALVSISLHLPLPAQHEPAPQLLEQWVMSDDRSKVLDRFVPGTEDYFFFHALHYQQTGQQEKFQATLASWEQSSDIDDSLLENSPRLQVLKNRAILLDYQKDPEGSIKQLSQLLDLQLDHQRPIPPEEADIPHTLNPKLISEDAFHTEASQEEQAYKNLTGHLFIKELEKATEFDRGKRLWFLNNITHADFPGIQQLVLAELQHTSKPSFGKIPGTQLLLLDQLQWLEKKHPDLRNQSSFVIALLARFIPGDEHYFLLHSKEKHLWLEKAWGYVKLLPPKHNAIKKHVLYYLLENHLERDSYPQPLFFDYIRITHDPLSGPKKNRFGPPSQFCRLTHLDELGTGDDQTLIQSYLTHLLGKNPDTSFFNQYIEEKELTKIQAEAQLLAGATPGAWGSKLDPGEFQKLRDRTEVTLSRSNAAQWAANDQVKLKLELKNAPMLDVRIFKIDALAHIRQYGTDPDVELKLNGLVPHIQKTIPFKQSSYKRHRYELELPELRGRGIWIVECISRGVSCRSLVRKGSLQLITRKTIDGQVASIIDENNAPVHPATLWINHQAYHTDKQGNLTLPFANAVRRDSAILTTPEDKNHQAFATAVKIQRITNHHSLKIHAGTDREQLLAGKTATLLIRPKLWNNGIANSLDQLKNATLHITANLKGEITTELSDIEAQFPPNGLLSLNINVPEDTRSLEIKLNGEISQPQQKEPVKLSASTSMAINRVNDSHYIAQPLLSQTREGWQIELLGRNGEPLAQRVLNCSFSRLGFLNEIKHSLRTDANGLVQLGKLENIDQLQIKATEFSQPLTTWLSRTNHHYYEELNALPGETLRIPHHKESDHYSLIQHHGNSKIPVASMNQHLKVVNGELTISQLPAGAYSLFTGATSSVDTEIHIINGKKNGPWIHDKHRTLEYWNPVPLHIPAATTTVKGKTLQSKVVGANKDTYVIAIGTRYYHDTEHFNMLDVETQSDHVSWAHSYRGNEFLNGRTLSDEYRYILDRRKAPKFVGNMLARPSLLLHPWAKDQSDELLTGSGAGAGGMPVPAPKRSSQKKSSKGGSHHHNSRQILCFDFLARQSVIKTDLKLDKDGSLSLDLDAFAHCQSITLIAVNEETNAMRIVPLPGKKLATRERRLDRNLNPKKHYVGTRATAILKQGASAEIHNVLDADWRAYTSLSHVFDYFHANTSDPRLLDFLHLMSWPELNDQQRRASAQLLASHEFHLFAYFKDRQWFNTQIKPLLENKRHRTFIDHFLLGDDLTPYLKPWQYQQLNAAEKALLAKALPAHKTAILTDLKHVHELNQPTLEEETRLFASALKQNALALRDRLGIAPNDLAILDSAQRSMAGNQYIQQKLHSLIIPAVDFNNTTVDEALNFVRLRSREIDPDSSGINFLVRRPTGMPDPGNLRIKELKLRDVPVGTLIRYICDATRLRYKVDRGSVVILPLEALEINDLATRAFVVPPNFLATLSTGSGDDDDPFGGDHSTTLKSRVSAKELLMQNGINFPDNAQVTYNAQTNTLIVNNTEANLDIIEQVVSSIRSSGSDHVDSFSVDGDSFDASGLLPSLDGDTDYDDPFGGGSSDDGPMLERRARKAPSIEPDNLLTEIWSESNYYRQPNLERQPRISANPFWIEFIEHDGKSPFLSARFTHCTDSLSSMLIAMAVLDLPFSGEKPEVKVDRLSLKVKAKSPMLLFYRDTRETKKVAANTPLLVRRNFFRLGDRTRQDEQGRTVENPITGNFIAGVPYTSSFVITNPTGTPRDLQVLTQIPRGAIPLSGEAPTLARDIKLPAHATQRMEYHFYFPLAGNYPHFPAHVLEHDVVQTSAIPAEQTAPLKVLAHANNKDTRSWLALARDGSDTEVLTRLETANLIRTPMHPILWRLANRNFYQKLSSLLRRRLYFSPAVSAYGFQHADTDAISDYLENDAFANQLGKHLTSPLLTINSQNRKHWEHLEFEPLVNPRQHSFIGQVQISNQQAKQQYQTILGALRWKPNLTQDDRLTLTYHLFLQDRISEALQLFSTIQREQTPAQMQYDYLHCYALFYQEKPEQAAEIAKKWKDTTSVRWQERFAEVSLQAQQIAAQSSPAQQSQPGAKQVVSPQLKLTPADGGIGIEYTGINNLTLRFFAVDLEVLFSENPFLDQQGDVQPSIQANQLIQIKLPKEQNKHQLPLTKPLHENMLVVAESETLRQSISLNSSAHQVHRNTSNHSITVLRSKDNSPLPRCYVKVYVETTDGEVKFFKDGYTDLRGIFPYQSHTSITPAQIKRYAILTSHPEHGSKVTRFK